LQIDLPPQIKIKITSSIPVASGLGSGAAVTVALIRALSAHLNHPFNDAQVNELCYEIEKIHHGTPSGIDNTVITYARPVYFIKDQPIETLSVNTAFTILIADTGIPAPTKESVGDVRKLWLANPTYWEDVFDQVGGIARQARQAIESGNWRRLGPLMDANHVLLQEMTVSSPELDRLVQLAKAAGAEGAKLSGGGRGGNMIALVAPENANEVANALQQASSHTIITTVQ
jgi:mevalonate kinase